jgi:hypothetical protein
LAEPNDGAALERGGTVRILVACIVEAYELLQALDATVVKEGLWKYSPINRWLAW